MAKKERPEVRFPAVPSTLQPGDEFYDRGRRYMLEQFDGSRHTFRDRLAMDAFVALHGFPYVDEEEMARDRTAYDSLKDSK